MPAEWKIAQILVDLYKQYKGHTKEKRLVDWLAMAWQGREYLYTKYYEYYKLRERFVEQLLNLYPDLEIQGEDWVGRRTTAHKAKEVPFLYKYAPILHYRKVPNEIVIEIDNPDESNMKEVVSRLESLGITPLVCHSGNKSWHIHFLTYPNSCQSKLDHINYSEAEGVKEFTDILYTIILREAKIKDLDVGVQFYNGHWIRAVGSLNVDKETREIRGVKKPVNGVNCYTTWYFPRRFYLAVRLEMEERRKKEMEKQKKIAKSIIGMVKRDPNGWFDRKYAWIRYLLEHPEIVKDGREVLLWLAIVPYLYCKGYKDEEIMEICRKWVEGTGVEWKSKYKCKVKSMIKHCKEFKTWYPISLDKLISYGFEGVDFNWLSSLKNNGVDKVSS